MNHLLAKFKHWIESQIGYRPPLPQFHPVIPLLHPYTPVPAWYKPITPYCITVTPSYTPVAWSTNCLDLSIVSKFNLADPSRTICSCCHFFFTVTFTSQGAPLFNYISSRVILFTLAVLLKSVMKSVEIRWIWRWKSFAWKSGSVNFFDKSFVWAKAPRCSITYQAVWSLLPWSFYCLPSQHTGAFRDKENCLHNFINTQNNTTQAVWSPLLGRVIAFSRNTPAPSATKTIASITLSNYPNFINSLHLLPLQFYKYENTRNYLAPEIF